MKKKTFLTLIYCLFIFITSCKDNSSIENPETLAKNYKSQIINDPLFAKLVNQYIDFSVEAAYLYKSSTQSQWQNLESDLGENNTGNIISILNKRGIGVNESFNEALSSLNLIQEEFVKKYDSFFQLPEDIRNKTWYDCLDSYENTMKSARVAGCCESMRNHLWGCLGASVGVLAISWWTGLAFIALKGAVQANSCISRAETLYGACCN